MRRGSWGVVALLIFVVLLVGPFVFRWLQFYNLSTPDRAAPPVFEPAESVEIVTTPEGERFAAGELEAGSGRVLLDLAHNNNVTTEDMGYLDSQLALRGFDLVPFESGSLQSALRSATAFVVAAPLSTFTPREITTIKDYVARGGRLLLIGDPTRFGVRVEETEFDFTFVIDTDDIALNGLANEFDLIFNGDYAFNVSDNEGNFRNIIFTGDGLPADDLTEGLDSLVLYGAHSLAVGDSAVPLLIGDDETSSSIVDRPGELIMAARSADGRVVAMGDINFLTAPYYTTFDNGAFIARLADFLTDQIGRRFVVGDFPFFFSDQVDLIYTGSPELGPNAFDEVIALQDAFNSVDIDLALAAEPQRGHDVLYLGLYNQAEDVADLLEAADIELVIDPPIVVDGDEETPDDADADTATEEAEADDVEVVRVIDTPQGKIQMSGTALILLDESDGRRTVVVLAASSEGLNSAFARLLDLIPRVASYALEDCLLADMLAICPTGIADEAIEAELDTGGAPGATEDGGESGGEGTEPPDDGGAGAGEYNETIDAYIQGTIALGETVEGELAAEEAHGWLFADGPAVLDITLQGDDIDAVIAVYDENDELVSTIDSAFSGEAETLRNLEVPAGVTYTIVARDFFGDPGAYTLGVVEGVGLSGSILIIADDDGVAQSGGSTGAETIAAILEPDHEVFIWSTLDDGPVTEELFVGVSLVIWASGDYRNEEGLGDDDLTILEFIDTGGSLLIIGATPTIYEPAELAPIGDLEVTATDSVLSEGLTPGDILLLDQSYDAVVVQSDELLDEGSVIYLLRGPDSGEAGAVAGFTFTDLFSDSALVVLLAPFDALPVDIQPTLLGNMLAFVGLTP